MNHFVTAVEAQALTKIYGSGNVEVVAMRDVSFTLSNGEVVALVGPSGAGKSTLLTIIGLINAPTSGKLIIGDDLVADGPVAKGNLRSYRRRFIGYVLQKANLIPFLTGLENVQLALEINDVPARPARARAMELLEYLGVGERVSNLPHMLSGGEQQRVASLGLWPTSRVSCSRMNRPQRWIVSEVVRLWNYSELWLTSMGPPCLSPRTIIALWMFLTASSKWRTVRCGPTI